jgi:phosphosulfolactate synthase
MDNTAYPYLDINIRARKPRTSGLTLVHDSGLGMKLMQAHLETTASVIDYCKFRSMTHALYPEALLVEKIQLLRKLGIKPFMGGNVTELAYAQGRIEEHLDYTKAMGWQATEISETYIEFPFSVKQELIKRSRDAGIEVFYEWGLKHPLEALDPIKSAQDIKRYLELGVQIAIIEEGEIDMLIGKDGLGDHGDRVKHLFDLIGPEHLMVECGSMKQVGWFMRELGSVINIGNIALDQVIEIEPLRYGIGRAVDYCIYDRYLGTEPTSDL